MAGARQEPMAGKVGLGLALETGPVCWLQAEVVPVCLCSG